MVKNFYNVGYRAGQSIGKAHASVNSVTKMRISDENKHQYISCVGSQGGTLAAAAMLGAGVLKEGRDLCHKLSNAKVRESYGGSLGVIKDSVKDMKNNLYGAGYGLTYRRDGDCDSLLKRKIK